MRSTPRPRSFMRFECKACNRGIVALVSMWGDLDELPKFTAACPEIDCGEDMTLIDGPEASHAIPPPDDAPHVFVATTQRNNTVTSPYALSMMRVPSVLARAGIRSTFRHEIGGSIQTQRSRLVSAMLATPATHLFFVDDDLDFRAEDIVRLVEHDRDVVAGVYARREILWPQVIAAAKAGADPRLYTSTLAMHPVKRGDGTLEIDGDLLEAVSIPAGFLLIKRAVLERMITHYVDLLFTDDEGKEHAMLFDTSIENGVCYSEDVTFSRRWRAIGGSIWVDMKARIGHIGAFEFCAPTLAERFAAPAK